MYTKAKGHSISKANYGVFNSSKKRTLGLSCVINNISLVGIIFSKLEVFNCDQERWKNADKTVHFTKEEQFIKALQLKAPRNKIVKIIGRSRIQDWLLTCDEQDIN